MVSHLMSGLGTVDGKYFASFFTKYQTSTSSVMPHPSHPEVQCWNLTDEVRHRKGGAFERSKFRKPDDGNLHNIDIRGGGRSWAGGAVGVHILSFHLEFMLVCMHFVLAKYFRSTVWWAHEGLVSNVHELHSAAVYSRLPHCRRVYSLLARRPWPTARPREWHRASRP